MKKKGFTTVNNILIQRLIQLDLTKRQLSVLMLIIRLSNGCQRSSAYIPKLVCFRICGVGKTNITEVLESLVTQKVIIWNKLENTFAINQNVQEWEIGLVSGWEETAFRELLKLNLAKSSPIDNSLRSARNQTENTAVIKKITENHEQLSKQVFSHLEKPFGSKEKEASKYIIKEENNKEITIIEAEIYEEIEREYCSLHNKKSLNQNDKELIDKLINIGIPAHFIIQRMKETYTKKIERDETVNSFAYYERPILDSWRTFSTAKATSAMREQPSRYQSRQERQNEMLLRAIREETDDKD
ncbi:putative prophage replication protein O [Paenibacillus sp. FSL R7-269]|uniref:replication protein n=1 Tax=Paenibacillus sp. FSL R7-269 TaxID=1226755 RepID=UPI0003E1ECF4|nr:replication protein [Paenibacillus sp. FSL R7-269]ETT53150.1 putative prophage replication protein O [Paenibacillus sp. FSL R7-269]